MDYMYTRAVISGTCVVAQPLSPTSGSDTPTETMARIQHMLLSPRRPLSFSVGGDTLFSVGNLAAATAIDAKNGPKPLHCTITRITDASYLVDYAIECHVNQCGTSSAGQPNYVSHRWTETIDIDRHAMSKKTRVGRVIARSDMVTNADLALRGLVSSPLEPDMQRISSQYTLSPDGLQLSYQFVDEEQYIAPPSPASEAEGEYSESTNDGAVRYGEVRLMLRAAKLTSKGILLARCLQIAVSKLQMAGGVAIGQFDNNTADPRKNTMLVIGTIRENLYRNEVEVRVRAMLKTMTVRRAGMPFDSVRFTTPLVGADVNRAPFDPGTRGTAQLQLVGAALQDPCLRLGISNFSLQAANTPTARGITKPAQVSLTPIQGDDAQARFKTTDAGVYTQVELNTEHRQQQQKMQLPVGKKGASSVIIQTAEPTQQRVVAWTASKIGERPKVPDPTPADPNAEVLDIIINPGKVEPSADGVNLKYTVSGEYVYAYKRADLARLSPCVPPWVQLVSQQEQESSFTFDQNIITWGGPSSPTLRTFTGAGGTGSFRTEGA